MVEALAIGMVDFDVRPYSRRPDDCAENFYLLSIKVCYLLGIKGTYQKII
jgi:hypothetical protein